MSYTINRMAEIVMQDNINNGDILLFNNFVKNYISNICLENFDHEISNVFNALYKLYRHGYDFRTSHISASHDKICDLKDLADTTTYIRYLNDDEVKEAGSLINATLINLIAYERISDSEINEFLSLILKMNGVV